MEISMDLSRSIKILFIIVGLAGMAAARAQSGNPAATGSSAMTVPQAKLIQPGALSELLQGGTKRPVLIQVGSRVMFQQAHIPNSKFAGPGSQAAGLELLKKLTAPLSKDELIVIYCGCCPWNHCPNIGPAFKQLQDLGFTNVKALYIAHNFGDDWVAKGYPVEKGE